MNCGGARLTGRRRVVPIIPHGEFDKWNLITPDLVLRPISSAAAPSDFFSASSFFFFLFELYFTFWIPAIMNVKRGAEVAENKEFLILRISEGSLSAYPDQPPTCSPFNFALEYQWLEHFFLLTNTCIRAKLIPPPHVPTLMRFPVLT